MIPHRLIRSSLLLWAALHLGLAGARAQVHGLYREVFTNSSPMKLEQSVNFPTRPLFKSILTQEFETPLDIPYLAGQRVRGLLVPRSSGPYRFFVSCDGAARLYLGTNETSESRALIASVPEWSLFRDYTRAPSQASAWINLTAGTRYYIEAVHDYVAGAPKLSVTWQAQRDPVATQGQDPISAELLTPLLPLYGVPPTFSRGPQAPSALLGEPVTFDSYAVGTVPIQYQWYRGTSPLGAETNRTLRLPATTQRDAAAYRVVASNAFGSVTSVPTSLVLQADPGISRFSRAEILGSMPPEPHCLAVDAKGNIYIAGQNYNEPRTPRQLAGTVIPGTGRYDVFVAKLTPDHTLQWVNTITNSPSIGLSGLVTDSQGSTYVTGVYAGPGNGASNLGLAFGAATNIPFMSGRSSFLAKYDAEGTVAWVRQIAATSSTGDAADVDTFGGITLDSSEHPVVSGSYRAQLSLDPTHTLNSHDGQIYVASYTAEGQTRSIWGDGTSWGASPYATVVDPSGDIFMSGTVSYTVRFGTNTPIDGANGKIFVGRWTSSGQLVWIQQAGGAQGGGARSLVQDAQGNVYIYGYLGLPAGATARFGSFNRISQGGDTFLSKYDPSGNCLWVSLLAGKAANDTGLFLDGSGNLNAAGYFAGTVSCQGTTLATYFSPPSYAFQPYVFQFSPSGTLLWAQQASGPGSAFCTGIAGAPGGGLTLVGGLAPDTNPTDFGTRRLTHSLNTYALYLTELKPALSAPPVFIAQPVNVISTNAAPVSFTVAAQGTPEISYQWFFNGQPILGANDPKLLINPPARANQGTYRAVASNAFGMTTSAVATLEIHYPVSVTVSGPGRVQITPADGGVAAGSSIQLLAIPNPGNGFIRWTGDASGRDNPLTRVVDKPLSITAEFASSALVLSVVGSGTVSADPPRDFYDVGQQVSLLATPARYYNFSRWSDGSTANPRTITIGGINHYSAIFTTPLLLETLTLGNVTRTAPVGMPMVLVDGNWILAGRVTHQGPAQIELRTTFPSGELFFSLDGSDPTPEDFYYEGPFTLASSRVIRSISMNASLTRSVEADPVEVVILPTVTLDATTPGGGSVTTVPAGSRFPQDAVVQLRATPQPGFSFLGWSGDLSGTNPVVSFNLSGDRRVQAIFGTSLSLSSVGHGRVVAKPSEFWLPYGTEVALYPVPDPGSAFAAWNRAVAGTNQPALLTITNPNPAVAALFLDLSANEVTLSAVCEGVGQVEVHPGANRYRPGATVQLRAIAGPGEEFLGWSGAQTGHANPLQVTLSTNAVFIARFTQNPVIRHSILERAGDSQSLRLEIGGAMGGTFEIQGRDSLETSWRRLLLGTNHLGVEQFIDPIPPGTPQRLYRAIPLTR